MGAIRPIGATPITGYTQSEEQYYGSSDTTNFIPELYAKKVLKK